MKQLAFVTLVASALSLLLTSQLRADCPLAHTHIGVNPDWRPDNPGNSDDDNQLWFFSLPGGHPIAPTPGWPQWGDDPDQPGVPFLKLVPEFHPWGDPILKNGDPTKQRYTCSFKWSQENGYGDPDGAQHLDGWHSAHPDHGMWNLAPGTEFEEPDWDIGIERESTSVPQDDFFMLSGGVPVLDTDGGTHKFTTENNEKSWLAPDYEAWGIHSHMQFHFYLTGDQLGETVSATFTAFDDSGMYETSEPYEFRFQVIPEPGSAALFLVVAAALARRRNAKGIEN